MCVWNAKLQGAAKKRAVAFVEQTRAHTRNTLRLLPAQESVQVASQRAQNTNVEPAPNVLVHKSFHKAVTSAAGSSLASKQV